MFSRGGNRFQKILRIMLDILNILLGIAIVGATIWTFLNVSHRRFMFPYIFAAGAAVNLFMGLKNLMNDRKASGIAMLVACLVLAGLAFLTYHAVGGIL